MKECLVAPLAGAWIEMWYAKYKNTSQLVAPLAGAWIEIEAFCTDEWVLPVAPLAGAWIEISYTWNTTLYGYGRSPRGSVD